MTSTTLTSTMSLYLTLVTLFCSSGNSLALSTLINSGADENLIDCNLADQLPLSIQTLQKPHQAHALDGPLLSRVTHQTTSLQMLMEGSQKETISCLIIESPQFPLIVGYPWLCKHNPHIGHTIKKWGGSLLFSPFNLGTRFFTFSVARNF